MPVFESANIILSVDDTWLNGYVQFKFFTNNQELLSELTELLKTNGINTINKYNVKKAILDKDTKQKYLISKGIKPVDGFKEHYKLLIDITKKPKPVTHEDGSVDYKKLVIPNLVKKGEPILEKIPENPGVQGKSIKGEVITPNIKNIKTLVPSKELEPSLENPNIFVTLKSGLVTQVDNTISITTRLVVNGDVNFSTGSIDFPGSVRVAGDVKSGFSISADGDVEIQGMVEDANLQVGGNLTIKQGFSGQGTGEINCKNNVSLVYAVNQKIQCKNLVFQKEIVNCNITADKTIQSKFGKIIGGDINAGLSVDVNQIGHEESASAKITIGCKSILVEKKQELERQVKEHNGKMVQVKEQLYDLFKKQIKNLLLEKEETKLKELQTYKSEYPHVMEVLEDNLSKINAEYEEIKNANLTVKGILYPGTKLEILGEKIPISKMIKKVKFVLHNDEIKNFNI